MSFFEIRGAGAPQYNFAFFLGGTFGFGRRTRDALCWPPLAMNEKSGVGARRLPGRGSINDDFTAGGRCLGRVSRFLYAPSVRVFADAPRGDRAIGRSHRARMHWK